MHEAPMSRRAILATGGLAAGTVLAGLCVPAAAETPLTASERANLKLVQDFCGSWNAKDFDPGTVMTAYLAEECSARVMDTLPFATSPAAVASAFKSFMPNGERVKVEYLYTFARGPLVLTRRIDIMTTPGKPDQKWEVVGVFLVKDGKIKEWTDYVIA